MILTGVETAAKLDSKFISGKEFQPLDSLPTLRVPGRISNKLAVLQKRHLLESASLNPSPMAEVIVLAPLGLPAFDGVLFCSRYATETFYQAFPARNKIANLWRYACLFIRKN